MASETEELESLARDTTLSNRAKDYLRDRPDLVATNEVPWLMIEFAAREVEAATAELQSRLDRQERVIAVLRAGLEHYAAERWYCRQSIDDYGEYHTCFDGVCGRTQYAGYENGYDIAQQALAEADKIGGEGE